MSVRDGQPRSGSPQPHSSPTGLPLSELIGIFRRRSRLILSMVAVMTVMATLGGLLKGETYSATALVMIQPQENSITGFEPVAQGLSVDREGIETQAQFIRSPEVLGRAVRGLDLENNPSLIFPDDEAGLVKSLLPSNWSIIGGLADASPADQDVDPEELRKSAIAVLNAGLEIAQSGYSNILAISYTTSDAVRAAFAADAVAKAYVEFNLDQKLAEVRQAGSWLTDRVEDLRLRIMASERAIEEYRAAHDLFEEGSAPDWQQIAALTTQLIDASAERTARQAKLRRVGELRDKGDYELLADHLSSPMLVSLRQEELALVRREAELSREYGQQHPRIRQLESEKTRIADRIERQIDNALRGLESELELARAREEAFLESLKEAKGEAKGQSALTGRAGVQLRELEREASADRALYESFLVRLKGIEEQQQIIKPDVRIVSPAEIPLAPSSPPPLVFALIGFTGSVVLSSILAMLLEQQDSSLRHSRQIESLLGVQALGLIPAVEEDHQGLHDHFISRSSSAFAEGVRSLLTQLRWASGNAGAKVLLVTSALPGEGKTSLAGSLALCAAQLKQRVLLIDLDLRRPAVGEFFGLQPDLGIVEFLEGTADLGGIVQKLETTKVHILAVAKSQENPTALLVAERLQLLLQEARTHYDRIIIDAPPVLGIADAKILAPAVDAILFVIRWERTKRDAARAALKELDDVSANVVGAILNNVDMKRHAQYAYGDAGQYYLNYSRYYRG